VKIALGRASHVSKTRPLSLRSNFTWSFLGNGLWAVCQWGTLAAIARLGTPEMVGQFSMGLALTAPVIMFTNLSMRAVQATDARDEYVFGDYLGLRLVTTSLALLIIIVLVLVSEYGAEAAWVVIAVGIAKALESVSDIIHGLLQKYERMDRIAISLMLKGPLSFVTLGILVWATGDILCGVLGMAVSWGILLLVYDIRVAQHFAPFRPRLVGQKLWHLTQLSLPLGIVMMLISLNTNIPRYFIEHYWGERELGYFSAVASVMVAGNMVVTAMGKSATPRLSRYYEDRKPELFGRLLFKLVSIGIALGLGGVAISLLGGRYVLTILYRSDYAEYADVLTWLMGAAGLGYVASFLGYGMTAARHFCAQVPLFGMVTTLTCLACVLLVPSLGLRGAAYALLVGASTSLLGGLLVNVYALRKLAQSRV
jgi:O-antigen/teichoic acid export membrane protein